MENTYRQQEHIYIHRVVGHFRPVLLAVPAAQGALSHLLLLGSGERVCCRCFRVELQPVPVGMSLGSAFSNSSSLLITLLNSFMAIHISFMTLSELKTLENAFDARTSPPSGRFAAPAAKRRGSRIAYGSIAMNSSNPVSKICSRKSCCKACGSCV